MKDEEKDSESRDTGSCSSDIYRSVSLPDFFKAGQDTEQYAYIEEEVKKGELVLGVTESGSLSLEEAEFTYDIDLSDESEEESEQEESTEEDSEESEEEDTVHYPEIEEVYIVSGQRIKAGDPVFQLSGDSVEAVRKYLNSQVTEKKIALSEAVAEQTAEEIIARTEYETSKLTAELAESQYTASVTKAQQEIINLQAQIKALEQEINSACEDVADEDFLEELEEARLAYEKAEQTLEDTDKHSTAAYTANYASWQQAKSSYETLSEQKTSLEETILENQEEIQSLNEEIQEKYALLGSEEEEADRDRSLSQAEGSLAGEIYAYTQETYSESVDTAQAELSAAEEKLQDFETFAGEDGILYAAEDGLVTAVNYEEGDSLISTGALYTYAPEHSYMVSVDVSEEDVSDIAIGDKVQVAFTAYPDEIWEGTVSSITTTKTSDYAKTVSYPVDIQIEGDISQLYGGMSAQITFVSDSVSDALYISRKAIVEENGKTYVYVDDSQGNKVLKEVTTGFENSTDVQITEGLSEGEIVYMRSQVNVSEEELYGQQEESQDENQDGAAQNGDENNGSMENGNMPAQSEGMMQPPTGSDNMGRPGSRQ